MQIDAIPFIRFAFALLFLGTIFAGAIVLKNYDRLFGPDPDHPHETSGARAYSRMQIFVVWLHAVILTGGFAFLIH